MVLAVIINFSLLAMLIIAILWCLKLRKNYFERFTGSLLYSLRNKRQSKVTCVYALFCIHKVILSLMLPMAFLTRARHENYYYICLILSAFVSCE